MHTDGRVNLIIFFRERNCPTTGLQIKSDDQNRGAPQLREPVLKPLLDPHQIYLVECERVNL